MTSMWAEVPLFLQYNYLLFKIRPSNRLKLIFGETEICVLTTPYPVEKRLDIASFDSKLPSRLQVPLAPLQKF